MGRRPGPNSSSRALLSPGLHRAAGPSSFLLVGPARELQATFRGCPRCPPSGVPASTRSDSRHDCRSSHLVPDPGLPPSYSLHRDRWWPQPLSRQLDCVSAWLPRTCPRAVQGVPRQTARPLRSHTCRSVGRDQPFFRTPSPATSRGQELGRLQQGTLGRPYPSPALPRSLHSSHCHRQRAPGRPPKRAGHLSLPRPSPWQRPEAPYPPRAGLHPALPLARAPSWLCPGSAFRLSSQRLPHPTPCSGQGASPLPRPSISGYHPTGILA
jgi:hypothetical protein